MKSRYELILNLLRHSGREIGVDELASKLGVSVATVRRDLEKLESEGLLIRTHGGAIAISSSFVSPSLRERMRNNLREKIEIAETALQLVGNHETIILSDGSTTYQIALLLKESPLELRVITNDLNISLELAGTRRIETILIGGRITDHYSVGGYLGEKVLESLYNEGSSIDKAFIGADAIDLQYGLTAFRESDVKIIQIMAKLAKKVIAVVDHTKFGNSRFTPLLSLEEVDLIITDSGMPQEEADAYRNKGIELIIAQPLKLPIP